MTLYVDPKDVQRYLDAEPLWHPDVRLLYQELTDIYAAGSVTYDPYMPFHRLNLRYKNHPQTNLSEAYAANILVTKYKCTKLKLVETKKEQLTGRDIRFDGLYQDNVSLSVKMANIPNIIKGQPARSFTIYHEVADDLLKDQSDAYMLVDIHIKKALLIKETQHFKQHLHSNYEPQSGRYRIYYDQLLLPKLISF